ncbi:MAG: SDR family oxidoreductase [Leptospiraceae bacterium]|nr:SDR family oxidoreductase [Leptospiraceae bacterium]
MLKDKVVVITGGAGRIGSAFIDAVSRQNGIGVIADLDATQAEILKNKILEKDPNRKLELFELDITLPQSVQSILEYLHKKYGKIDALVNNAYPRNKNFGKKFFDVSSQDFSDFVSLHLGGYFNMSQKFIQYFLTQGYGNIINISSIQGVVAPAFETYVGTDMHSPIEYTVAKHGLIGMTKYMAKMFKKDKIRVNAISPGGILDKQPEKFLTQYKNRCGVKGMLDAEDLTGILVYLLSDSSEYMTGQNLIVDDGFVL